MKSETPNTATAAHPYPTTHGDRSDTDLPQDERRPAFHLTSISVRADRTETEELRWDLNHSYVEMFWLPVIGPTSTLFLRFVGRNVSLESFKLFDPSEIAVCLGVNGGTGRHSPISKTISRLAYFELVCVDSVVGDTDLRVTVPLKVPQVPPRRQIQWPEYLRILHSRAVARQHIDAGKDQTR